MRIEQIVILTLLGQLVGMHKRNNNVWDQFWDQFAIYISLADSQIKVKFIKLRRDVHGLEKTKYCKINISSTAFAEMYYTTD